MNENERIVYEFLRKIECTLAAFERLEAENAKLRELVKDIDEVADPFLWEFIGRRMRELGIEVDG